jgi:hypothetical protein
MPDPTLDALLDEVENAAISACGISWEEDMRELRKRRATARAALTDYVARLEAERDVMKEALADFLASHPTTHSRNAVSV